MRFIIPLVGLLLWGCGSTQVTSVRVGGCGTVYMEINESIPIDVRFCELGVYVQDEEGKDVMVHCTVVENLQVAGFDAGSGYIEELSSPLCGQAMSSFRAGPAVAIPRDAERLGPNSDDSGDEPGDELRRVPSPEPI